jgi:protein-tyrosine-phosphatase
MAEGIMKDLILDEAARKRIILPIDVMSAGTHAVEGIPASRHAVEASFEQGISLRFHRSRQLTVNIVRSADLILVMERGHSEYIRQTWPEAGEVHELKRFGRAQFSLPQNSGIADPMGGALDEYRKAFLQIREEIVRITGIVFPLIMDKHSLA